LKAARRKEIGLEATADKTKKLLSHRQNSLQKHEIKVTNRSSENVAQLKYLAKTVINQNVIQEEIN
jgi:hypothetical protein